MVSGIVTGDATVSYWSIFSLSLVTVPEVLAKVNSPQVPSFSKMGNLETSTRTPNTEEIQESIRREYLWGKFDKIRMDSVQVNWNKVCLSFVWKYDLKNSSLMINKISTKISMIMRKCLLLSIKSPFSRKATSSRISWFWIVTNYFTMLCFSFLDDSLIIKMCWIILSQRGYLSELPRQSLSWKRYAFHIFGVFRANILLHYFARYFRWSLRITFALCWRIFAESFALSSLPSVMCGCAGKYISPGKYLFHWVFFSVWWCKLAAVGRGGSRFQGCLGYLLALFFANLLGTSSQAHQLAMSLTLSLLSMLTSFNLFQAPESYKNVTDVVNTCKYLYLFTGQLCFFPRNIISVMRFIQFL